MKQVVSLILILAIMLTIGTPALASMYNPDGYVMYVKTGNGLKLNLRESPDANAKIIGKIPYGEAVSVYPKFLSDKWSHVQYGMLNGYVMKSFLVRNPPKPYVSPTPKPTTKPTPKPTATPQPKPEELLQKELNAARALGLVPVGMIDAGNVTWGELNELLSNAIRLKNRNMSAQRMHVYLSRSEYEQANCGAAFDVVLRGVAAAEMYGALMDMGEQNPAFNHSNDPFIADVTDIALCQEYAGRASGYDAADWRTIPLINMVTTIIDNADTMSGMHVMSLDNEYDFLPNNPLTRTDAILAVYRLYRSFNTQLGTVTVVHQRQANLRAAPSMRAEIIGKADPGAVYGVIRIEADGWYQIVLPSGKTAYIAAGMVSFVMQ